jgi:hypothetical protein
MNTDKELLEYKSFLWGNDGNVNRIRQSESLHRCLEKYFFFDKVVCIETGASQNKDDGCFGLYLGKIVESTGGEFYSVDIDEGVLTNSVKFYSEYLPNVEVKSFLGDSISYLNNFEGAPNLVHLDSWDLNLKNPVPSMLHGWLEFKAIEEKMPVGSIILVDDNFLKDTWVNWNYYNNNGVVVNSERIDITYDIVGKGSMIYHYCKNYDSDWEIIGDHYYVGDSIKLIIRKK